MKFTKEEKMAFVKRYQEGESMIRICNENQIPRSTFYRWIQDYQQTVTDTGTVVTPQAFQHLKRKVKKLEDTVQVLKTVDCTVSSTLQEKLKAMEALHRQFSVHTLCEALDVPRGTFYNHIFRNKRDNTLAAKRREELKVQIQKIYAGFRNGQRGCPQGRRCETCMGNRPYVENHTIRKPHDYAQSGKASA